MPKFSVVISVFNKEQHIKKTLESVFDQTFQDFEVVVVNDGSTDESERIIKQFTDQRLRYFYQNNKGAAEGRNTAIKHANGTFIALLDGDDYWYPHYLEEQNRLIIKYPNQLVFATAQNTIKGKTSNPKSYSLPEKFNNDGVVDYFESSYQASILHSSSTVLNKEVFNQVGYYNPAIKSGQDTDLYIRIGLLYPVAFSIKICSHYHVWENSLYRNSKSLADKIDFSNYEPIENQNPHLKKFLDLNRFSLAIFAKLHHDMNGFEKNYKKINLQNLNKKQRFILKLSSTNIKLLYRLKNFAERYGLKLSTFK